MWLALSCCHYHLFTRFHPHILTPLTPPQEVKSLASQLGYTYSANRRAPMPFKLLFTGLGGRTLERLESQNDASYKRWQGTEWWREGYEGLWEGGESGKNATAGADGPTESTEAATADIVQDAPATTTEGVTASTTGGTSAPTTQDASAPTTASGPESAATDSIRAPRRSKAPRASTAQSRASAPQSSVVYLTADSEVELSELKEDETYIIGGICDHNRYKVCLALSSVSTAAFGIFYIPRSISAEIDRFTNDD